MCQVAGARGLTVLIEGLHELEGSEEGAHAGDHPLQAAALRVLHPSHLGKLSLDLSV